MVGWLRTATVVARRIPAARRLVFVFMIMFCTVRFSTELGGHTVFSSQARTSARPQNLASSIPTGRWVESFTGAKDFSLQSQFERGDAKIVEFGGPVNVHLLKRLISFFSAPLRGL